MAKRRDSTKTDQITFDLYPDGLWRASMDHSVPINHPNFPLNRTIYGYGRNRMHALNNLFTSLTIIETIGMTDEQIQQAQQAQIARQQQQEQHASANCLADAEPELLGE